MINSLFNSKTILYLMLSPYLMGLVGLILFPALLSLALVFSHYDALTAPVWAGHLNLSRLLGDRLFWIALSNTFLYLIFTVIFRLGGALALALMLHRQHYGIDLARATVYLPTLIPDVAYALIWLVAFNPRLGPVNLILGALGLPTPAWTIEPWPAFMALVIMATWQLGEGFVLLLASLKDIPNHLYESAALDGAGYWDIFYHITFPLILPQLSLLMARDLILNLQANFVPSLLVTKGGPGYATLFLPLYVYFLAFDDLQLGYAAAVVWVMYIVTLVIVVAQFWVGRYWRYDESF